MRYLPLGHLVFLVALMLAGLTLAACGGGTNVYTISSQRLNSMCPKTGVAQVSLTTDGGGYQSASVTCKSGKVAVINSWDSSDVPAEGQQVVAP